MKKSFIVLLAAVLATLAVSSNARAAEPDKPGTVVLQIQGGAFPGMGALASANIAMANIGKGHLYGGVQGGYNLRTGAVTEARKQDLSVGARFTYGFNLSRVIEFHLGGLAGVAASSFEGSEKELKFCYGGLGGFRLNFTPVFGMVLEGCYSQYLPYASAGFSFRF